MRQFPVSPSYAIRRFTIFVELLCNSQPFFRIGTVYIQGVPGGKDVTSGVFLRSNYTDITQKNLYPKFNGYGDIGQRKAWTSLVSA